MYRITKIIFVVFVLIIDAEGQQQIGQWKSYTDMKSVRCAVQVNGNIWAATGGGVFVFDTTRGLFTKFTNTDGLDTNDILTIAFDGTHYIWIGEAGGYVNIYDINTQQWQAITDIANNTEYNNKGIQSFNFKGDTVFIVSEFGVSIFKRSRWEFGDTYINFGFTSPQLSCSAIQQNRLWIGTDKGLAVTSLGSEVWTTYNSFPGLISSAVTALAVFNDALVIGTAEGAVYFAPDDTMPKIIPLLNNIPINGLQVSNGKLYVLSDTGSTFFTIETLASVLDAPLVVTSNSDIQGVCIISASPLWIATASKGLAHQIGSTWNYLYPNGPNSNFFSSIAIDSNGVLWCASGSDVHAGFYKYNPSLPENNQWENFTRDRYPIMGAPDWPYDDYYRVSLANGSVWVSSWGNGVVEVVGDSIKRNLNYYSKPGLPHAIANIQPTSYVVTGSVAEDVQGKTWISNRVMDNNRSLLRLDSDTSTTCKYFDNKYSSTAKGWFHSMIIDQNGTKWLAGDCPWETHGLGLYIFNENSDLTLYGISTTGGWGYISSTDGLQSDIVLALTVDLDGAVWIGTSQGVTIVSNPQYPTQFTTCYALLTVQRYVQAIATDALNNKWIGTNEGIFVVNSDGSQLLQVYDVASTNRRLFSNDVRSIAIDQKRGIAYFGTQQGLSSLTIAPIQTSRTYSKLECGPNPFILQNGNQQLTIRNLVANSTIKILSVSGSVVRQFDAQGGGRAFWDGRDKNGAFVASGIYFIVASAENGSQTVTGKVAVIRH